jgi:hypothetical protein
MRSRICVDEFTAQMASLGRRSGRSGDDAASPRSQSDVEYQPRLFRGEIHGPACRAERACMNTTTSRRDASCVATIEAEGELSKHESRALVL